MQWMTLAETYVKWSVILADRVDPEILTMLEIRKFLCEFTFEGSLLVVRLKCALNSQITTFISNVVKISGTNRSA